MYRLFTLCLSIFLGLIAQSLLAQNYPMSDGSVNTCSGVFLDDGGVGGAPYTTTSYTFTICPDDPDDVVQVDFFAFSLWQSPNPNNSDALFIFDGPDDSAFSLGAYTGSQLQGLDVTATINNPTGCLTFVFQANPNGNINGEFPGWEAEISCTTPCSTPTSVGEIIDPEPSDSDQSVGACIGDPITFSDNGSTAGPGFDIETYRWNFGDGTIDTTSGAQATHIYNEPGEYIASLTVIDDNGCSSINIDPMQVLISTIPVFNVDFDGEICLGATSSITANPESTTWTALPPQVVSGETYLADGAGFTYSSSLTFDFFEPGATLETCEDFLGLFINMEHSYLGDLEITLFCPNDSVNIFIGELGQTQFLGEPVDDEDSSTPGIGNTYTWTPDATNGNLNEQPDNFVDYVDQDGSNVSGNIIPEGTYESLGDLCDFVGCPLNGTWTLSITDNLAVDDGYIFNWGIDFAPELFPDVTTFTPVIGMESDSSFWSGPNLEVISDNGNEVEFTPDDIGDFDFTFSATNNFGCVQDTTITITVVPGPEADAGEDLVICEDSLQMSGGIAGEPPIPSECEYTLEMYDSFGDGWNGFSITVVEDGATVDTYTIIDGYDATASIPVTHGATIQLNTTSGGWDSEVSYDLLDPAGNVVFSDAPPIAIGDDIFSAVVDCSGQGLDIVYEWSPSEGLSDPNIYNPMVMVNQNTTYTLTIWEAGTPECNTSDEVEVTIPPEADPGQDNDLTLCYNEPEFALIDSLIGDPTDSGEWTDENGNVVDNTFNPADYSDGGDFTFTYTVTFGPCTKSAELSITVLEAGNTNCCQTLADAGPDAIACDLVWQLEAEPTIGTGTWSGPPEVSFANVNDPNTTVTANAPGGVLELTWTDNNGFLCEETDTVEIVFMEPVALDLDITPTTCPDTCSGQVVATPVGGLGEFTYGWLEGQPGATDAIRTDLCDGDVKIYFEDEYGCSDSTVAVVPETPRPAIDDINMTNVTCYGLCDGIIEVVAPEAVSYSFDEGDTFQSSSLLDSLCPGTYDIEIRNGDNCPNYGVAVIDEPLEVEAEFSMNPSPANWTNTTIQFNSLSYPEPFTTYEWTFDTLNVLGTSSEKRPKFTFPDTEAGEYPVKLCVENEAGCSDCISYDLIIRETLSVYIPNSFTPNGDGINDLFKAFLSTEDYSDFRMRVFNRQGELVFETNDVEQGWNGGYPDSEYFVLNEVYVYEIQVTDDVVNETLEYTGHVTPVR